MGEGQGGGILGAIGFISIIVLLNALSYVFDWGYMFY